MDLNIFPRTELEAVLRSLRAVAVDNGSFSEAERDFLEAIAHMHGVDVDASLLPPITFEGVARVVVDPHRRKRAVQLAIVMALVEGEPSESTQQTVQALASALDVPEQGVRVLYEVSQHHSLQVRIDIARRMRRFTQGLQDFPGFGRMMLSLIGIGGEDPALAARYHALEACAPGTFGRAIFDHFREHGFAFPGDKHGIGAMVFHDIGHVLSGYGVEPKDEIQQAAFQAGFTRKDGFLFLLFGILQFHLGMRLTPVAKGRLGLFDVKAVLRAVERGAACRVDLGSGFDHFAYIHMPLDDVRRELGIPAL